MSAAAQLLDELRRRGGWVRRMGDRLRAGPREALDPELLDRLRQHKAELFELIPEAGAPATDLAEDPILEERREPVAWRLYSRLAERELWLARDERTRAELEAEFPGVPVLTLDEVPALRGKPPELLRAILATKAELPGARLQQ